MLPRLLAGILSALLVFQVPTHRDKKAREAPTVLEANGEPWGCEDNPIPPVVVSPDRILVTSCNSLYMLDSRKRVVWKWATSGGAAITDQPVIDSTGTIYVIALDLIWVALDASTGELKWRKDSNGRATYSQIKPYQDDQYLVVINMEGYREAHGMDEPDRLVLCKGRKEIWIKDFPANATLQVWGDRILAITSDKGRAEIVEIPAE